MHIILSQELRRSIKDTVAEYSHKPELLDIYRTATAIQKKHMAENVALEDIMTEILMCVGSNVAVSFLPPDIEFNTNGEHVAGEFLVDEPDDEMLDKFG